jgi:hypothetical protein
MIRQIKTEMKQKHDQSNVNNLQQIQIIIRNIFYLSDFGKCKEKCTFKSVMLSKKKKNR